MTMNEEANTKVAAIAYGIFIGALFSFNNSLKLYHWDVTGLGSYAKHIALDQAIDDLLDITDRIAETTIAQYGTLNISIPFTETPTDIVSHIKRHYNLVENQRSLYNQAFMQSILDDYQEVLQQLLYRLIRLK